MENKTKLTELLNEKKRLFLEVENTTGQMVTAPFEQLAELLETRGGFLEQAKTVGEEISAIAAGDEVLKGVIRGDCDMTKLDGGLAEIYEAALAVRAVVNRIMKNEGTVILRLESEKEALRSKIEAINASSNSVAESYERSVATGLTQASYTPPKDIKG